jgi:hypothetical protein
MEVVFLGIGFLVGTICGFFCGVKAVAWSDVEEERSHSEAQAAINDRHGRLRRDNSLGSLQ